jgi:hypothetical protein
MVGKTIAADEKYVKSGVWKCNKSPTGAHHWIELVGTKLANQGYFVCVHCGDVTRFPVSWGDVSPYTKKAIDEDLIPPAVLEVMKFMEN